MKLVELLSSRLLFVTGKGGVGKTAFSAAAGRYSALNGKKTLVVEIDNFHPSMEALFSTKPEYIPKQIEPNLFVSNILWRQALSDWLYRTVGIRKVVRLIEKNKVAMLFLDATPGAREIVILSKIMDYLNDYDQVIVDLPASGHALGILRVPTTAHLLMRGGPVHDRAKQILSIFSQPTTALAIVALPEQMVVNESLEFSEKIKKEVSTLKNISIILNRTAVPSLSSEELTLLHRLKSIDDVDPAQAALIQAGIWEEDLERASSEAYTRLKEVQDEIFLFPRFGALGGFDGGPKKVIAQMLSALLRFTQKSSATSQ